MNPRVTEVKPAIDFQLELTFSNREKTKRLLRFARNDSASNQVRICTKNVKRKNAKRETVFRTLSLK